MSSEKEYDESSPNKEITTSKPEAKQMNKPVKNMSPKSKPKPAKNLRKAKPVLKSVIKPKVR